MINKIYKKVILLSLLFISFFLLLGINSFSFQKNDSNQSLIINNNKLYDNFINDSVYKTLLSNELNKNKNLYGWEDGETLKYSIYKNFIDLLKNNESSINGKSSIGDVKATINSISDLHGFFDNYSKNEYYFFKPSFAIIAESLRQLKIDVTNENFKDKPFKEVLIGIHGDKDYFQILNNIIKAKKQIYKWINDTIKKFFKDDYKKFFDDDSLIIRIPEKEKFENNKQLIDKLMAIINISNFKREIISSEPNFFNVNVDIDDTVSHNNSKNYYEEKINDFLLIKRKENSNPYFSILANQKFNLFTSDWEYNVFKKEKKDEINGIFIEERDIPKNSGFAYDDKIFIGDGFKQNYAPITSTEKETIIKKRKENINVFLLNEKFKVFKKKWEDDDPSLHSIKIEIESSKIIKSNNNSILTNKLEIKFKVDINFIFDKINHNFQIPSDLKINYQVEKNHDFIFESNKFTNKIRDIFAKYRNKKEAIIYNEKSFEKAYLENNSISKRADLFRKTKIYEEIKMEEQRSWFNAIFFFIPRFQEEIEIDKNGSIKQIALIDYNFKFAPYFRSKTSELLSINGIIWYKETKITKIEKQKYIDEAEQYRDFKLIEFQNDIDIKKNKNKKYEVFKVETFDLFNNFKNNIIPNINEEKKDLDQALINYKVSIDQKYEEIKKTTTFIKENIHKELIKKYGANNIPPEVSKLALNNPKFLEELLKNKENFNKTLDLISKNKWLVDKIKDLSTNQALNIIKQLTNIENNRKYGFLAIGVSLSLIAFASLSGLAIIKFTKKRTKNNYYGINLTFSLIFLSSLSASIPAFLKFLE